MSHLPPPVPGGVAPKFGSEKVLRYTGVSQLQLRVSRYTVQLRTSGRRANTTKIAHRNRNTFPSRNRNDFPSQGLARPLCKDVLEDFCCVQKNLEDLPGIFLEDFSGHFSHKNLEGH